MADKIITKAKFIKSLKGTEDEVFSRLIQHEVKLQAMTAQAWAKVMKQLKGEA